MEYCYYLVSSLKSLFYSYKKLFCGFYLFKKVFNLGVLINKIL